MSDDGLVAALARAQLAFPAIVKSHSNPAFKGSQYADVADVLAAVRPVLAAEGIALTQFTDVTEWGTLLITQVKCGHEKMLSSFRLPVEGLTAQQVGSLLTYHRRYQLCALLGVHPVGDDDDGNLAATAAPARQSYDPTLLLKGAPMVKGDPYALAAANPPEKPLAAMTAGEMARYGESIGVRVTGSKADILRQLEPIVKASTGAEPFDLPEKGIAATIAEGAREAINDAPFAPTTFDEDLRNKPPSVRKSMRESMQDG